MRGRALILVAAASILLAACRVDTTLVVRMHASGAGEVAGTGFGPSLSVDGEGHPVDLLGDAFFVGAQNGVVRRIDRRTGAVAWQQQLGH